MNSSSKFAQKTKVFISLALAAVVMTFYQNCAQDFDIGEYTSVGEADPDVNDDGDDENQLLKNVPVTISAATTEGEDLLGYNMTESDFSEGKVFSHAATVDTHRTIVSSVIIPVDIAQTYTLSGLFRSVGTPVSHYYFGISCLDKNKNPIYDNYVLRRGNAVNLASINGKIITTTETLTNWATAADLKFVRLIGFYYDGNVTKLPDYVIPHAIPFVSASGNQITLTENLPANVLAAITAQTKIMNHYHGGTYLYTNSPGAPSLTNAWQTLGGSFTGEAWNDAAGKFRMGTKYVRIIVLPNYNQTVANTMGGAKMYFNKLQFQ